jgi:hypothetical protein
MTLLTQLIREFIERKMELSNVSYAFEAGSCKIQVIGNLQVALVNGEETHFSNYCTANGVHGEMLTDGKEFYFFVCPLAQMSFQPSLNSLLKSEKKPKTKYVITSLNFELSPY